MNDKNAKLQFIESINEHSNKMSVEDIVENSTPTTIGANYYLAKYLPEYFRIYKPDDIPAEYDMSEDELETLFMESIIPLLSTQAIKLNKGYEKLISSSHEYNIYNYLEQDFPESLMEADRRLRGIVDLLAAKAIRKLVSKKPITEKEYGYIVTKFALYVGDFFNVVEYNMLYIGLLHEMNQKHGYGDYSQSYLNKLLARHCIIDPKYIETGDEPDVYTRKTK